MRLEVKEKDIERLILDWLLYLPGCFAWKNQTGGYFDAKKGYFRRQTNPYAIKGVPDILGVYKGRPIAIEVKSKLGRISPEQKLFIAKFVVHGGIAGVCRSLEDAQALIKSIS